MSNLLKDSMQVHVMSNLLKDSMQVYVLQDWSIMRCCKLSDIMKEAVLHKKPHIFVIAPAGLVNGRSPHYSPWKYILAAV